MKNPDKHINIFLSLIEKLGFVLFETKENKSLLTNSFKEIIYYTYISGKENLVLIEAISKYDDVDSYWFVKYQGYRNLTLNKRTIYNFMKIIKFNYKGEYRKLKIEKILTN